jgi:hypothetical protein
LAQFSQTPLSIRIFGALKLRDINIAKIMSIIAMSIKNNDISWIGFTGNYGLIKDTTNEYNIFNNFINKINNLEYSDKISHYIFINGDY